MDKTYADTVRLLLSVTPDVFANDIFAMKGGTAINLFVRDMPRLSVDIDVVYTPWQHPREQALPAIAAELNVVAERVAKLGLTARTVHSRDPGDTKLLIESEANQVKVEVNVVFRGTVLPTERRALSSRTARMFSAELEVPVLATSELYGSKLVAAMDRQHPRDLFDVWQMFESDGLTDAAVECFVTYLAGHNRPTHDGLCCSVHMLPSFRRCGGSLPTCRPSVSAGRRISRSKPASWKRNCGRPVHCRVPRGRRLSWRPSQSRLPPPLPCRPLPPR
jgi:predicted nucleotidyltransferase component of viral defense system